MEFESEAGIWAKADATVFRLLMGANRTERRAMAAERTMTAALKRVGILRRLRAARAAREQDVANRRLDRALEQVWGRPICVRKIGSDRAAKPGFARRRRALKTTPSRRAIRAYAAPLVDARGHVALYFQIKYVGLKSKKWRPGLSASHIGYILRDDALEQSSDGQICGILSNMGETIEEIAAAWDAIEELEQAYRANATVQYRIVWNLPHDLNPAQRREMVQKFCERTFGELGLPWVAAIHKPDPKGDERNYHAHIAFSTRPCERTGDHEWEFAQEKIADLTNPEGLKLMRAVAAKRMNNACRAAGKAQRYTHLSYAERGIDAVRQSHVGPERMAAHERGESVAVIERNAKGVERNEAAAARDAVAHMAKLSERLTAMLAKSVEIAAKRERIATKIAAVRTIADQCRSFALRRPARPNIKRSQFEILARRTRIISTFRPVGPRHDHALMASLGQTARHIAQALKPRAPDIKQTATIRQHVERIKRAVDRHHAAVRNERARALVMNAPVAPYRMHGNRILLDLSAMAHVDSALVRSVDRESLTSVLRERHRADQERAEAAAKAKAAAQLADEIRRAAERDCQIANACRILRQSSQRPYRWDKSTILPDLEMLPPADRALIDDIGFTEPRLIDALHKRAVDDETTSLNQLYEAIRSERSHLTEQDGKRIVPPNWLLRFALRAEATYSADSQRELKLIAKEQANEKARIIHHVAVAPEHILNRQGRWTLGDEAPAAIRRLADAWRHDELMQSILEDRAAAAAADVSKKMPDCSSSVRHEPAKKQASANEPMDATPFSGRAGTSQPPLDTSNDKPKPIRPWIGIDRPSHGRGD